MKKTITLGPWATLILGFIFALLVGMLLFSISTAIIHYIVATKDFYSEITETQQKIIVYFPGIFLMIVSTVVISTKGRGKEEKIPELEEQQENQKKIEEEIKKAKIEDIKKTPAKVVVPIATTAGYVPVGFEGFWVILGEPLTWFTLSIGRHWRWPFGKFMEIAIVQTQPVTSEFKVVSPSLLVTEVEKEKFNADTETTLKIGKLAGQFEFFTSGFYTFSVYNKYKYFGLSESTRKNGLHGKINKAARDFLRSKSIEALMNDTSRNELVKSMRNVIKKTPSEKDGDNMTVDMFAIRVEDITVDHLEIYDDTMRDELAKPAIKQIKVFGETLEASNMATNIQRLKKAGIKDPEKAAKLLLIEDGKGKSDLNTEERTIKIEAGDNKDGGIYYLIERIADSASAIAGSKKSN